MSVIVSLLPVIVFLLILNSLDSFKLLKASIIASGIIWGICAALLASQINNYFFSFLDYKLVVGLTAPVVEELLKYGIIVFLFHKNKLGFLSDSLIMGFASGTGFSIIENIFYLNQLETQNLMFWIIRGFGTAVMHGTATGIASVVAQNIINRHEQIKYYYLLLGVMCGILIHAVFNNFFLSPLLQTILQISLLPVIVVGIFNRSENSLRSWMDEQYDSEIELLRMIKSGEFKSTRIGKYILSIKQRFSPEIIVDMLAFIQLNLELSLKAKGLLMMREAGFNPEKESEIQSMLNELQFLARSIGKVGVSTLKPIIHTTQKDLWKLNLLK